MRVDQEVPFRLWAPGRLHAFVSIAVVTAIGMTPGAAHASPRVTALAVPSVSVGAPTPVAEGDKLRFPVTLSESPDEQVMIQVSTTETGSATPWDDFTPLQYETVTFEPGGVLTKNVEVTTLADNIDEATDTTAAETVELEIVDPGTATLNTAAATGKIVDAVISVEPVGEITESDGFRAQYFDVNLNIGFQQETSFTYSIASSSDIVGGAVETPRGLDAGATTTRVSVAIVGDDLYEGPASRTVDVSLADFTGGQVRGLGEQSFPFPEDEPLPEIESVTVAGPVTEGTDDTVPVTVKLTGALMGWGTVVLDDVTAGTARPGLLYEADQIPIGQDDFEVPGSMNVLPGSDTGVLTVTIKDDEVFEATEDIGLVFSTSQSDNIGGPDKSLSITVDDDDPEPTITLDEFAAAEGASDVPVTFSVDGSFQGPLAWTADVGPDFMNQRYPIMDDDIDKSGLILSGSLASDGDKIDLGTLDVPLGHSDENDNEYVRFSVDVAGLGVTNGFGAVQDDPNHLPPKLRALDTWVLEGETARVPVSFFFDPSEGNTATTVEKEIKVDFTASSGTAVEGDDFEASSGTLPIDYGAGLGFWAEVPTTGGDDEEGNQSFDLTLSNPVGAIIDDESASVTIAESLPVVSVADAPDVAEGGVLAFPLTLSEAISQPLTVRLATEDGTATAGDDYEESQGVMATFLPGETTAVAEVRTTLDSVPEAVGETVVLKIVDPGIAAVGDDRAEGKILDPVITVTTDGAVGEGDLKTFDVKLTAPTGTDLNFSYEVVAGTATDGEDFDLVPVTPISIPAGWTMTQFPVQIRDDEIHESNDETIRVVLTGLGDTVLGDREYTFTITDDDAPPQINMYGGAQVREGDPGPAGVFTLSGAAQEPIGWTATLTGAAEADNEAASPADIARGEWGVLSGTIAPGQDAISLPELAFVVDRVDEHDENIEVTIDAGIAGTAVATVVGTDSAEEQPPRLVIPTEVSVAEGQGASIPVVLDFTGVDGNTAVSTGKTITVDYTIVPGAAGTEDYTGTSGTLEIEPGDPPASITIPTVADAEFEASETFTVTYSASDGLYPLETTTDSTVVTVTEAAPTVSIGDAGTVPEGNVLSFPVTLDGASTSPISVWVSTTGGTAVGTSQGGDDYPTVTGKEVRFEPGDTAETVEVPTNADSTNEFDPETVDLELTDPGVATPGRRSGTGTIFDARVTVTPVGEIVEGDSDVRNQVFDVKLNAALDTEVLIDYEVLDLTTLAGTDYDDVEPGRLTFAPGETEKQITVPIRGDTEDEGTGEAFRIRLFDMVGAQAAGLGEHTFIIVDDDGVPSIASLTGGPALEGDSTSSAVYTVTLSNPAPEDIVLNVIGADSSAVQADTGVGGSDYSVPPTVTIPADTRSATIDVTVNGDTIFEQDEQASVVVLPQDEAVVLGGGKSAPLELRNDDDPPLISVDGIADFETAAGIPVGATVTGKSQEPIPWTATVTRDSDGGSDLAEEDDFAREDLKLFGTLEPGAENIDMGTIRPVAGSADEYDETLLVTVFPENLSPADGFVTIKDSVNHLPPAVTVPVTVSVTESGTATVPVTLDFTAVPDNSATSTEKWVTVDYTLTPGTASAGTDYTGDPVQLSFPPSTTTRDITVPTVADDTAEAGGEDFTVSVTGAENATVGTASTTTVTVDDPAAVTVHTFTVTSGVTATEGQGTPAEITVSLDAPAVEDVDFVVSATDATARRAAGVPGGDDFSTPPPVLSIPRGQQSATVRVPILADQVFETQETAKIRVEPAQGETHATGAAQESTLTIADDDRVPRISLNTATGTEGGTVAVIATPAGVAEDPIGYLLKLSGAGSDPAEATDYVDSRAAVTLPGGSTAPVTLRSIPLTSDAIDEASETIRAIIENLTVPAEAPVESVYTITDDAADMPPVVSLPAVTAVESAGGADVPVNLIYAAGNGATSTERPVSVGVRAVPAEADETDFGAPGPNPLVIPAGSSGGTIRVPIVNDTRFEPLETFLLQTTEVTPAEGAAQVQSATVSITDDDPAPAFTATGDVSVREDAGTAKVTIELDAPAPGPVDFTLGARDDTATETGPGLGGDDYDLPVSAVQIAKGARSVTVDVPIKADSVYEGDEKSQLTVALAAGEKEATGSPRTVNLTIADDDAKPAVKLNPVTVAEGASTVVTAVVTGQAQREFDLGAPTVSGDGGTGDPADTADYELNLNTTLPAGTANASTVSLGTVRIAADTVDEVDEGFTLTVAGSAIPVRFADDPADVMPAVSITDVTVGESDDTADLTVSLDFPGDTTATEKTITVGWKTADGSAKAGKDYRTANGTITIDPSEAAATVTVPLIGDTQDEDDQLFLVRLGAPSPAGVTVAKADGKVTLEDDDKPKAPTMTDPPDPTGAGKVFISGIAAAGEKVELLSAPGPSGGTFRVVLTGTANSDGAYSFSPTLQQGHRLQVRSGKLTSPVRTVQVRQEPEVKVSSPSRGTARITVTGDPDRAGQAVTVQQQDGGGWDTVATGRLDTDGEFVTTERSLRSGRNYVYRATIAATPAAGILAGRSPSRTIRIK